jgi:Na+/H+ antiporter NhaC
MAPTLAQRLEALDQPDHVSDAGAMWNSARPVLVLSRFFMVVMIIIVGELFDDLRLRGLTIGVWALIAGIPLFLLISMVITYGDRLMADTPTEEP